MAAGAPTFTSLFQIIRVRVGNGVERERQVDLFISVLKIDVFCLLGANIFERLKGEGP